MTIKKPALLFPGDEIVYHLTAEIKTPRSGTFWCKVGASTTIQENETATLARARLRRFVHTSLEEATNDILI